MVVILSLWERWDCGWLKAIWQVAVGGILLGGIWALLLILCKKKGRKDFVPYSPGFILCGIIVYLLK